MFFTNNSTCPVGLDISDLSLKLVQLDKHRDKITIQALGKLNMPHGVIVNGEIKNKAELIKAIRKIISSPLYGRVSSDEVVACLPESKTFIKTIIVQKSPNALKDIIGGEIEKHVPLAVSEIYYDWQIIEELANEYFILIGAAPKDIVNQYTAVLDEAKLSPVALEIEPMSTCRCLLEKEAPTLKPMALGTKVKAEAGPNYGIIDIGANHTSMIFYSGNTILFTVSMPISGEKITFEISQSLGIDKRQAEKAKIICGLDEKKIDGLIKNILAETLKNLVEKIKEAIAFYENYFPQYGPLNRILLCGGGANISNLEKIIGEQVAVEVKLADALINLQGEKNKFNKIFMERHTLNLKSAKIGAYGKEEKLSVEQSYSATFTTAFGLALRGIFINEL